MYYFFLDKMTFHYFIDIVPTEIEKVIGKRVTYQYSVKVRFTVLQF